MIKNSVRKTKKVLKKRPAIEGQVQYVLPLGNGWVVKDSSASKFTVITDNRQEAVSIARAIAKRKKMRLIIYNKNGTIREMTSYA
jgi:hypothetical protein